MTAARRSSGPGRRSVIRRQRQPTTIADILDGDDPDQVLMSHPASILHQGSYHEMGESYATVAAWIRRLGHRILGPHREIYLNSQADVPEDDLPTEIHFPIHTEGDH